MNEAREKFKAAAHAVIDAMPDGVRIAITVTGEKRHAEVSINSKDAISWSSHSNAWAMMTAWGDVFMDTATPTDIAAKLYAESDKGEDPRLLSLVARAAAARETKD
jgi:hypothetical protein